MTNQELIDLLTDYGYYDLRVVNNQIVGLMKFAFTEGLVVGLTKHDYERRYCYEKASDAKEALDKWNGIGHPSGPWIKVKGDYLGLPIDQINPEFATENDFT